MFSVFLMKENSFHLMFVLVGIDKNRTHRIAKIGLINIVGPFEKWAFGILNENDLIEIDEKIKAHTGRNKMTLDLINIQTRIVQSTLNNFNNITNTINENTIKLKTTLEQLICDVNNGVHNIQKIDVSQTLTQHLIFFNIILTEFNQEIEELIESIVWGQNGQLHPSIINPNTIINQLEEIEKILPKQLSILQSPEPDVSWRLATDTKMCRGQALFDVASTRNSKDEFLPHIYTCSSTNTF
ncbi:hypothetical protein QTP88_001411 [Uroleucon formosanum]